jgi:tetratricopeptide (TPR) repeat protein
MLARRHTTLWLAIVAWITGGCAVPSATQRAQTLVRMHREDEAVAVLQARLASNPQDLPARRLVIRLLGFTGDLAQAQAQVEELAKRAPAGDPSPYLELGHALELAHRYDEALAAYDEAGRAAPAAPDGPREGGMRCARWGEVEQAEPRLEEAVRRGAHDVELWHTLGLVRLHLGDYDGAERAYREGVAVDARSATNWLGLATLAVARGDAEGALAAYQEVLTRAPRFGDAELGRAWALAKLGRIEPARQALDHAEKLGASREILARQRAQLRDAPR